MTQTRMSHQDETLFNQLTTALDRYDSHHQQQSLSQTKTMLTAISFCSCRPNEICVTRLEAIVFLHLILINESATKYISLSSVFLFVCFLVVVFVFVVVVVVVVVVVCVCVCVCVCLLEPLVQFKSSYINREGEPIWRFPLS